MWMNGGLATSLQQMDVNVLCVCVCAWMCVCVRAMTHLEDLLSDGAIIGKPHSDTSANLFMHNVHLEPPLSFLTL